MDVEYALYTIRNWSRTDLMLSKYRLPCFREWNALCWAGYTAWAQWGLWVGRVSRFGNWSIP